MRVWSWVKVNKEIAAFTAIIAALMTLVVTFGGIIVFPNERFANHQAQFNSHVTVDNARFEQIESHIARVDTILLAQHMDQKAQFDSLMRAIEPLRLSACISLSTKDAYAQIQLRCERLLLRARTGEFK